MKKNMENIVRFDILLENCSNKYMWCIDVSGRLYSKLSGCFAWNNTIYSFKNFFKKLITIQVSRDSQIKLDEYTKLTAVVF